METLMIWSAIMFSGERLKKLREEMNLTQIELGKVFNISHSTINRYENGLRQPDNETLINMSNFFNVSVDYLLGISNTRNDSERVTDVLQNNAELQELWDRLKERQDLQLLFKQVKDVNSKGIQQIIRIIKAIEDEEGNK